MLLQQCLPFTVLKLDINLESGSGLVVEVATVLTVYGIETFDICLSMISFSKLQQCLPFTVLKL